MKHRDNTTWLVKLRIVTFINQIVLQIATPAIFILKYDVGLFGFWLAANTYSSFLGLLDFGLFAVIPTSAISQTSKNLSQQDKSHLFALRQYSTAVSMFGTILLCSILYFGNVFKIAFIHSNLVLCAILSSINVLLILKLRYFEASYRSINSAYGFTVLTFHSITTTITTITSLYFQTEIFHILLLHLGISLIFIFHYQFKGDAFTLDPEYRPKIYVVVRKFFRLAIAYQMFSVGYLIMNQGINIVIQFVGDLDDVGKLGILRIAAGIFRQISGVFINSAVPQLSFLLKVEKFEESRIFFRKIKLLVYSINTIILLFIISAFILFLLENNLTIKGIPPILFILFVTSAFFDIPWNIWSTVSFSANSHVELGLRFICSSLLTLLITFPAYIFLGLLGIPLALLVQDIVMTKPTIAQGRNILGLR